MAPVKPSHIIRLSKSCLSPAEKQAVMGVLDREYLGMGAEVQKFEQALTDFFGRPAVAIVNGTAALQLAVQACGIGPGDEVLIPSLTYVASFQAVAAAGATPVACDVRSDSLTLDWRDAETRLTARTRAVMPVHYTGGVADFAEIQAFAHRYKLRVIEDAAHAFGTTLAGRRIGGFGDIACFSFDGIKNITCGEGGCVVTDDQVVLGRIRDARLLGVERDTEKRYQGGRSWEFNVTAQGWRYHMSNIMAAIGIEQLRRQPEMAAARQALARQYDELFAGNERIRPIQRDYNTVVPHIYVVRIVGLKNRAMLQTRLLERNIQTGIHYQPSHTLSYFARPSARPLSVLDAIYPEILTLPLHFDLTAAEVAWVCESLKEEISRDC